MSTSPSILLVFCVEFVDIGYIMEEVEDCVLPGCWIIVDYWILVLGCLAGCSM